MKNISRNNNRIRAGKRRRFHKCPIRIATGTFMGITLIIKHLLDAAICSKKKPLDDVSTLTYGMGKKWEEAERQRSVMEKETDQWLDGLGKYMRESVIRSADGLRLHGTYFLQKNNCHQWVTLVHGYRSKGRGMQLMASQYAKKGYHVLIPDLRGCGKSGGKYIGMGWLDRKDIVKWIDEIIKKDKDAKIVLHGVSMGGATVMMTSGEELPHNVKAIVEDCGYTSVWDIFSDRIKIRVPLPRVLVMALASVICKIFVGYAFKEASALKQVEKNKLPMLFIHGSEDRYVRTEMVYQLYKACPTPKELLIVDGAGHANSYLADKNKYFETVFSFLERYVG